MSSPLKMIKQDVCPLKIIVNKRIVFAIFYHLSLHFKEKE